MSCFTPHPFFFSFTRMRKSTFLIVLLKSPSPHYPFTRLRRQSFRSSFFSHPPLPIHPSRRLRVSACPYSSSPLIPSFLSLFHSPWTTKYTFPVVLSTIIPASPSIHHDERERKFLFVSPLDLSFLSLSFYQDEKEYVPVFTLPRLIPPPPLPRPLIMT